jgi:hypothetical protein
MADGMPTYERGPDATVRAGRLAWERAAGAHGVVLVEGVSDQIAVEAVADVLGVDLGSAGIVVVPIGGAHAIDAALSELGRLATSPSGAVLCDAAEEPFVRRALERGAIPSVAVAVCDRDLEDELIRATGPDRIDRVVRDCGDEGSFATMRAQPAWRDAPYDDQVRRFIGAGAGRKHRYAAALVRALAPEELPTPLTAVIDHVLS